MAGVFSGLLGVRNMTAAEANYTFILHRKACKVCASDGPAVCETGMELLHLFHQAIIASLDELEAQRGRWEIKQ